jgi:hypothetical protein
MIPKIPYAKASGIEEYGVKKKGNAGESCT